VGKHIRITPYGGLGNQMFQYIFALALKARVPEATISGPRMPRWKIAIPTVPPQGGLQIEIRKQDVPFEKLVRLMQKSKTIDVELPRLNLRVEYFGDRLEQCRRIFPPGSTEGAGPDEIAINIRGAEILSGKHQNFIPIPLSFYEEIIGSTGLRPVFVGQIGDDSYSAALRSRFPEARFVNHGFGLRDFHYLRASHTIVVAVSSYSWLAAWLSETARRVYLPVVGLYHPGARPDCNFLPRNDRRYVFLRSNLLTWRGAPEELSRLIDAPAEEFGFRVEDTPPSPWVGLRTTPRRFLRCWARRHFLFLHQSTRGAGA
jgi:hypothetical protein